MRDNHDEDTYTPSEGDWERNFDNPESQAASEEVRAQLEDHLAIGFIGTASSGKTAGIKALFDIDLGTIHPIPGSTTEVTVREISDNVVIVDAPGFGDTRRKVSGAAKDACDRIDVFVYVINAEGGYKDQEKEDFEDLRKYGRPTLVVMNKIDLLRENQRKEFSDDQRAKMGVLQKDFIEAAFDPLPQLSPQPINLPKVQDWIQGTLERVQKDILFAKHARGKDRICNGWILGAAATAATIGAAPIPGSDFIPLTALQVGLVAKIAAVYGHKPRREDIGSFIAQTMGSGAGRWVFRAAVTALKALGWLPGGQLGEVAVCVLATSIASGITFGIGKAAQAYYKSGMKLPMEEVADIFKRQYEIRRSGRE